MITSCTAYPVRYFYIFRVWCFIEETPGWLCCYSLSSSADGSVKEPKTTWDFVTVVHRWGLYLPEMSDSAPSTICCSAGDALWGIEPQANQKDLYHLSGDPCWTVPVPGHERMWPLRLSVLLSQAPTIQHGSLRELLAPPASEWLLVFPLCLALSNLRKSLEATKSFWDRAQGKIFISIKCGFQDFRHIQKLRCIRGLIIKPVWLELRVSCKHLFGFET